MFAFWAARSQGWEVEQAAVTESFVSEWAVSLLVVKNVVSKCVEIFARKWRVHE